MPEFPEIDATTRRLVSPVVLAAIRAQLEEAGMKRDDVRRYPVTGAFSIDPDALGFSPDYPVTVIVTQDAVGGRAVTFPPTVLGANGGALPAIRTGALQSTALQIVRVGDVWWASRMP